MNVSKLKDPIAKCKQVVLLLDELEELRPLFKKIVKLHVENFFIFNFYIVIRDVLLGT